MPTNTAPGNWKYSSLKDAIAKVIGGGTPPRAIARYWKGNIPWASVKDFQDDMLLLHDTQEHISREGLIKSAAHEIAPNILVICTRMAVGRAAIVEFPTAINQDLKALYPKSHLQTKFLLYFLHQNRQMLEALSIGSTVKGIATNKLLSLTIGIPPIYEQRCITRILDTLDSQIQQTERLVARLKQMKAGLLQDLLTRGIDENGYVRDPVAHPEEFKNTVLGSIPKVWKVGKFEILASIIDPQPSHRAPAEVVAGEPYIGVGDLRADGSINFESCRKVSFEAVTKQEQRFSIEVGDIIFGKIGTIGFPQFLPQGIRYALNANTVIIKPKYNPSYVLWLLRSSLVEKQIQTQIHSTTQPAFGIQRIRAMFVPLPDKNEQHRISLILDSHNARITAEETELAKLKQLKKGLMHDLLTGRVRVTPLMAEGEQLNVQLKSVTDCK